LGTGSAEANLSLTYKSVAAYTSPVKSNTFQEKWSAAKST
jgi:hypothetical protein